MAEYSSALIPYILKVKKSADSAFQSKNNLREKCVNRDDDKSAYINQKSKKCII